MSQSYVILLSSLVDKQIIRDDGIRPWKSSILASKQRFYPKFPDSGSDSTSIGWYSHRRNVRMMAWKTQKYIREELLWKRKQSADLSPHFVKQMA